MNTLFKTPENVQEIHDFIDSSSNPAETMAAVMMYQNYVNANFDLTPKK